MIYLASPYSHPDPAVQTQRFDAVCHAAAALMRRGHLIFSPIAHSHGIARYGLPGDWGFWQRYDRMMLGWCRELWVLTLPGWDRSVGVAAEIDLARQMNKPVRFIDSAEPITEKTPAGAGVEEKR